MQVAGEHMVRRVWFGLMLQGERAQQQGLANDFYAQFGRWVAGASIMVAANQRQPEPGVPMTPGRKLCQGRWRMGFGRVEKVAEKDQPSGGIACEQGVESRQIGLGGAARDWLAEPAVGGGLAEMNVAISSACGSGQ